MRSAGWPERSRAATVPLVASGLSGLAIAMIVAADGGLLWRSLRVAAVGLLTFVAVVAVVLASLRLSRLDVD